MDAGPKSNYSIRREKEETCGREKLHSVASFEWAALITWAYYPICKGNNEINFAIG